MAFLSVYRRMQPIVDWCDDIYNASLPKRLEDGSTDSENASLIAQFEAEALGRVVCLGAIAVGTVLTTIDIAITTLIGVGAFACSVAQTRYLYKNFMDWQKDTEIETLFLMNMINSAVSLRRSIYGNAELEEDKQTSLGSLLKCAKETQEKCESQPICSRTNAITQLFFPALFEAIFNFFCGCSGSLFNVATLGLYRKKDDAFLTKLSSGFLFAPVNLTFHTLSCFIHLAKPRKRISLDSFLLKDASGMLFKQIDMSVFISHSYSTGPQVDKPLPGSKSNSTDLIGSPHLLWDCSPGKVKCFRGYQSFPSQEMPYRNNVKTVVLVSKGPEGTFAVKDGQIVLAEEQTVKMPADGSLALRWVLKDSVLPMRVDENSYLVSDHLDYAVLGINMDGYFILNGGSMPINQAQSTMLQVPEETF